MVTPATPLYPAVGACRDCNQVFLVLNASSACLLCGRPPSLTLPFDLGLYIALAVQSTLDKQAEETAAQDVDAPLAAPEEPPIPAGMSPITVHVALDCPLCRQSFVVITTDAHIFVVPPTPAPPVDEAATVPPADTVAVPPPDEEPPTPAMGRGFYGKPIPGQLVAPEADESEETPA
jgi:hypothetical protein